jgi:hypothetical protein
VELGSSGNKKILRSNQPFGHVLLTENMISILGERVAKSNVECFTEASCALRIARELYSKPAKISGRWADLDGRAKAR